ncbi:MAG TPA: LacI family DNA-binding transcriptional regulator [Casimicrobiaceae bacterium]|jgi:LacI family gluconate utilization system Gnt-I transcriptional repressor
MSSIAQTAPRKPRKPSRMQDVARMAKVSVITVSRVLREPERVAEGTRARVLAAIERIGYVPNLVARSLKSQRSGIVAAVIPSVTHSIVAEVVRGMTEVLEENGLHLLLGDSGFSPQEEEALVAAFLARRPDAMYLTGTTHTPGTRKMLATARIPVVETGNLTATPIDMVVGYSNFEAARAMTGALIAAGRRTIGYIGQRGRDYIDRVQDRHAGYVAALRDHALKPPSLEAEVDLSFRGGAAGVVELLSRRRDIDALFCTSDVIAIGALFECQRRGIGVPRRVAIAGMDDQEIASQCVPALSTMRMPRYEMGRRAATLLCRRIAGDAIEAKSIDLGFDVVLRETS